MCSFFPLSFIFCRLRPIHSCFLSIFCFLRHVKCCLTCPSSRCWDRLCVALCTNLAFQIKSFSLCFFFPEEAQSVLCSDCFLRWCIVGQPRISRPLESARMCVSCICSDVQVWSPALACSFRNWLVWRETDWGMSFYAVGVLQWEPSDSGINVQVGCVSGVEQDDSWDVHFKPTSQEITEEHESLNWKQNLVLLSTRNNKHDYQPVYVRGRMKASPVLVPPPRSHAICDQNWQEGAITNSHSGEQCIPRAFNHGRGW